MFECIFRSVRGVKRTGMQDKRAITSYFRFAQRRRLPMFTAQALASNTCSGPKTCYKAFQLDSLETEDGALSLSQNSTSRDKMSPTALRRRCYSTKKQREQKR